MGVFLLAASLLPLGFLLYTLTHLKKLDIPVSHPRVIVEAALFLIFLILGFVLE